MAKSFIANCVKANVKTLKLEKYEPLCHGENGRDTIRVHMFSFIKIAEKLKYFIST